MRSGNVNAAQKYMFMHVNNINWAKRYYRVTKLFNNNVVQNLLYCEALLLYNFYKQLESSPSPQELLVFSRFSGLKVA